MFSLFFGYNKKKDHHHANSEKKSEVIFHSKSQEIK